MRMEKKIYNHHPRYIPTILEKVLEKRKMEESKKNLENKKKELIREVANAVGGAALFMVFLAIVSLAIIMFGGTY